MSFLAEPPASPEVERLYDADTSGQGYVMNLTRLWAHQPAAMDDLQRMLDRAVVEGGLIGMGSGGLEEDVDEGAVLTGPYGGQELRCVFSHVSSGSFGS